MLPTISQYIFSAGYFTRKACTFCYYSEDYFLPAAVTVDCVPGALLMVSCQAFRNVGGYDPNIFLYGEETTLGIKIKSMGYQTILLTKATYHHMHSASINKSIKKQKTRLKYLLKSRIYILKNYLNASSIELLFAKSFYSFVLFEYGIYIFIQSLFTPPKRS